MDSSLNKFYVGDGVYARFDKHGDLILTTEDGLNATNVIILEPAVWESLKQFAARQHEVSNG